MADEEKKDGTNEIAANEASSAVDTKKLSSRTAITKALRKGDAKNKASRMRKARKRNDLRADAYHSAKSNYQVPMRVKIMIGLILVTVSLIMINQFRTVQKERKLVDNVYLAAKAGDYKAVKRFLDSHPEFTDMPDLENNTLMHYGAMASSVDICRKIIEMNGNIARINNDRRMPIHYAAENGNAEIVQMLINRDTYVTLSDKDGMQPIHLAARTGSAEVIRKLLKSRAKVNSPSSFLMTPMHHAAQSGQLAAVKALLEFKPKLKILNSHGYTPLHIAVICKNKEIAKYLIAAGASPHWASKGTDSALDLAKKSEDPELQTILLTPQAEMKALLEAAKLPAPVEPASTEAPQEKTKQESVEKTKTTDDTL